MGYNQTYTIGIIGDKKRANEIKEIFKQLGGNNRLCYLNFDDPSIVYYITSLENIISCSFIDYGISQLNLKVYTIDEFYKAFPFKIGERVKSVYGDWYTEIIEMKEIDGEIKYRVVNSGIYYFQSKYCFEKCDQSPMSKNDINKCIDIKH